MPLDTGRGNARSWPWRLALYGICGFAISLMIAWCSAVWIKPEPASAGLRNFAEFAFTWVPDEANLQPLGLSVDPDAMARMDRLGRLASVDWLQLSHGKAGQTQHLLRAKRFAVETSTLAWLVPQETGLAYAVASTVHAGWPLHCLTAHQWIQQTEAGRRCEWNDAVAAPAWMRGQGVWLDATKLMPVTPLPLRVVWSGMLLNTLLFACLTWFVWSGWRLPRRAVRRRRGRCPDCGYALAGLPAGAPCPECGRDG